MRRRQVATGGVTLIVSFGDAIAVQLSTDSAANRVTSFVAGLHDGWVVTEYAGPQAGVQIDLSPIGAYRLLGVPPSEIANGVVDLDALDLRWLAELPERLAAAPDWSERFVTLDRELARRAAEGPDIDRSVAWAWRQLTRFARESARRDARRRDRLEPTALRGEVPRAHRAGAEVDRPGAAVLACRRTAPRASAPPPSATSRPCAATPITAISSATSTTWPAAHRPRSSPRNFPTAVASRLISARLPDGARGGDRSLPAMSNLPPPPPMSSGPPPPPPPGPGGVPYSIPVAYGGAPPGAERAPQGGDRPDVGRRGSPRVPRRGGVLTQERLGRLHRRQQEPRRPR